MSSAETSHTQPQYELLYHPGIPGRGEFVRLVFEAAGIAYKDISNESEQGRCARTSQVARLSSHTSL